MMDIKVRILGLLPIIVLVTNRDKKEDIIEYSVRIDLNTTAKFWTVQKLDQLMV